MIFLSGSSQDELGLMPSVTSSHEQPRDEPKHALIISVAGNRQLLVYFTSGRAIRRDSTMGRKGLKSARDKKRKARTVVGRGDKSRLCRPGSELRLGGRGEREKRGRR